MKRLSTLPQALSTLLQTLHAPMSTLETSAEVVNHICRARCRLSGQGVVSAVTSGAVPEVVSVVNQAVK